MSRANQKELEIREIPPIILSVIDFMQNKREWKGSATELLTELEEKEIAPTVITKILNEYHYTKLKDNKISYAITRNKYGRQIILKRDDIDDNDDSNIEIPYQ